MPKRHVFKRAFHIALFAFLLPTFFFISEHGLYAKSPASQQTQNSCLWSVQTQSNKIYFLGSLHLLKQADYPLAASIHRAYADSNKLIFETDIDAALQPAILMKMQELGLYPEGESLFRNLDARTRKLLEKKITDLGLPLALYTRYKPWLVAQDLALRELAKMGFNPVYGVDFYFFNKAKADGKEMGFLESPEFQLDLIGNMVAQDQKDLLNQTLNDLDVVNELASDLVKFWKTGDSNRLHDLLYKSFKDYPDLHDRLLIQRNKKWVAKVENLMRENKNVLFVVGAGHLVGPESVIDLLRKKGYKVKQQ